ncbi:MAG TPA: hypothetical protein VFY16_04130 [Gemmatimonadaceae bacterium]|jgi:ABC-type transporter Mla subunit MlaD|nr:hypothetical protein [Gemmatimonadaceae bacterium]
MSVSLLGSGVLLLQAVGRTLPDTQVIKQVTTDPGLFEKISTIAGGLGSIMLVILAIGLIPAALNFRRFFLRVNELLDRFYGDITPLVHNASAISDNVNYVTTALRSDVRQVTQTVAAANHRVLAAMKATEQRIQELNALLDVVQEEAEAMFVSGAATVRGLRAGARTYEELGRARRRAELLDEELAEALDDSYETGDVDDGDDERAQRSGAAAQQPRVRPRRRG